MLRIVGQEAVHGLDQGSVNRGRDAHRAGSSAWSRIRRICSICLMQRGLLEAGQGADGQQLPGVADDVVDRRAMSGKHA
ncbi:hypothetical protein NRF20_37210 [Streptomyces sp. R-74717]|uniref:hypothetical protein n=1 Tax=Streptomyces TaxID=1883 RepID=UPI00379379E7